MKFNFFKFLALILVCVLLVSLAGCDKLDYRKAIDLYNRRKYDAAAEAFAQLDGYEDSGHMITLSNYWAAIDLMEAGEFSSALPRFIKLGDFEDSALRVTECKYQIALHKFDAGNYEEAQRFFEEVTDYKQTQEYLRRIHWQTMYDAIIQKGVDQISASAIEKEYDSKTYSLSAVHHNYATQELHFEIFSGKNGDFSIQDGLKITLTRDSTVATFEAGSGFGMDFLDGRIGSSQLGYGRLDITTCTSETPLVIETLEKHVDDNHGNSTSSTDPADSTMGDTMAVNFYDLMTAIPQLLQEAGIAVTLQDIGFSALS